VTVEAIAGEKKFRDYAARLRRLKVAIEKRTTGALLALEFVNRPDTHTTWKARAQPAHLRIVGSYDHEVIVAKLPE